MSLLPDISALTEEVSVGRCACSPLLHPAQSMKQGPAWMLNGEGLRERGAATPTRTTVDQKAAGRLSLRPCVDESGCRPQCLHHVLLGVLTQTQLQIAEHVWERVREVGNDLDLICDV